MSRRNFLIYFAASSYTHTHMYIVALFYESSTDICHAVIPSLETFLSVHPVMAPSLHLTLARCLAGMVEYELEEERYKGIKELLLKPGSWPLVNSTSEDQRSVTLLDEMGLD